MTNDQEEQSRVALKKKVLRRRIKNLRELAASEYDNVLNDVLHGRANKLQSQLNKLTGKPKEWGWQ